MGRSLWPSDVELQNARKIASRFSGRDPRDVKVVVSPYRICPLGAHIDHQGGAVSAMTINRGVLLAFVPSGSAEVLLRSAQFEGDVKFRVDETQLPKSANTGHTGNSLQAQQGLGWGKYARGAVYALKRQGYNLNQGITGVVYGSDGLDSSGLSSSAAVGVAYLLALENVNDLAVSPTANIELDRLIENEYFGLKNGILDQSAILLSHYGYLTYMNCKTKEHTLVYSPILHGNQLNNNEAYKILLAFSGLKHSLPNKPGYNNRVAECKEAARILLEASGNGMLDPLLCNVDLLSYESYKAKLEPHLAKRAEHYYSENVRVHEGIEAWKSGRLEDFGRLISSSGLSSIKNYECGCEPLIQLHEVLLRAPGVLGARFSGAGFRGCCLAFVHADRAEEAASFVRQEYRRLQPKLAGQLTDDNAVVICEAGDCAHVV